MWGLAAAALLCGLVAGPTAAWAMPPAAKQYLPVIPTADGPATVKESAAVEHPDQLTPAARASLKGPSNAELRKVATAKALGAPSRVDPGQATQVEGDQPSFLSAAFGALAQGPVLGLLAGFALITGLLVYVARSRTGPGVGSPTS
jgi:hypothetical protein